MFGFLKRKQSLVSSGVLKDRTDRHSHILFGVDDGIQTLADSLAALSFQESIGITDVWCTPHIMEDTPNTTEGLRKRFDELRTAYSGSIRLHLAAEYMLDNLFEDRFKAGDLLTMEDNMVLVETSTWNPPPGLYDAFRDLQKAGYHPLFAHPERCRYLSESGYESLYKMGVHFQLNIPSVVGYYGETAQRKALFLLEKGWYSHFGSDCHRLSTMQEQYNRQTLTNDVIKMISMSFRPNVVSGEI